MSTPENARSTSKRSKGVSLSSLLPKARRIYAKALGVDPRDINLREVDGVCSVVMFPTDSELAELDGALQRSADGTVVVAESDNWKALLG